MQSDLHANKYIYTVNCLLRSLGEKRNPVPQKENPPLQAGDKKASAVVDPPEVEEELR